MSDVRPKVDRDSNSDKWWRSKALSDPQLLVPSGRGHVVNQISREEPRRLSGGSKAPALPILRATIPLAGAVVVKSVVVCHCGALCHKMMKETKLDAAPLYRPGLAGFGELPLASA